MDNKKGKDVQEIVKEAMRAEHMADLRKYTLGELVEAIDKYHKVALAPIDRREIIHVPEGPLGGPAIILYFRDNLSKEDTDIQAYFQRKGESIYLE